MKKVVLSILILLLSSVILLAQMLELSTNPYAATTLEPSDHLTLQAFSLNPTENIIMENPEGIRNYYDQNYYFQFVMPETYDIRIGIVFPDGVSAGMLAYTQQGQVWSVIDMTHLNLSPGVFDINQLEASPGDQIVVRLWFSEPTVGNTVQIGLENRDPTILSPKAILVEPDLYTPQELVEEILVTGCLEAFNVTYTGDMQSIAYFMGNIGNSGFDEGFILSTGDAEDAEGPDQSTNTGTSTSGGSDPDLAALHVGFTINDAAVLEFDFIPATNELVFDYIFGSEEFHEFANSRYNDVFGFFLSGPGIDGPYSNDAINIALLPNGDPVTIDNIYNNSDYYVGSTVGNTASGQAYNNDIEFDGASIPLTATAEVTACETYHIKLAIGDAGDSSYDSGVFFKAESFTSGASFETNAFNPWYSTNDVYEGCQTYVTFTRLDAGSMNTPLLVPLIIGGTATMGEDYVELPANFMIPAGQMEDTLFIDIYEDGIPNENETITFTFEDGCPCDDNTVTITIDVLDEIEWMPTLTNTGPICEGETATINLGLPPGVDLALADWEWTYDNSTGYSINVTPEETTTYTLEWTHPCETIEITNTVVVSQTMEYDMTINDDPCFNTCEGSAEIAVTGGILPYTYSWDSGTTTLNNLCEGAYSVTVTDGIGCEVEADFFVDAANEIAYETSFNHVDCFGNATGNASVFVTGGIAPYSYLWSNGSTSPDLQNLIAGIYEVTVSDANGCSITETFDITQPEMLDISFDEDVAICEGGSVDLTVTPTGGTLPYTIYWSDGGSYAVGDVAQTVTPERTVTYSVYVEDAQQCVSPTLDMTITVSSEMSLDLLVEDVNCNAACDGRAELMVNGGIPPFDFSWYSDTRIIENLCPGNYAVTVVDQIGCFSETEFSIDEPTAMVFNTFSEPASCPGVEDGSASVTVSGATSPYTYLWGNGSTDDNIQVASGIYRLTITDAHGCREETQVEVDAPQDIVIIPNGSEPICIGGTTSISAQAIGGSAPYSFYWEGDDESTGTEDIMEVSPVVKTDYYLTVTDQNGCEAYQNFTVDVHPPLEIISVLSAQDTVCHGFPVRLFVDVDGGNGGPYTLQLANGDTITSPYTFYPEASQMVYVTLSDECETPSVSDSIFIGVWPNPENNFTSDIVAGCPPLSVAFSELNSNDGNYYQWAFGDNRFGYGQNITHVYTESEVFDVTLLVRNKYGCETVRTINEMIEVYPQPIVDFYATPNEASIVDPEIQFTAVTEFADSLFWNFGDGDLLTMQINNPVHFYPAKGEYGVTLIGESAFGCTDTAFKYVRVIDEPTFWAPNVFTPNDDGENDCFRFSGNGIDPNEFYFAVFNRWGEKVFETDVFDADANSDDCSEGAWDGTNTKKNASSDTYLPSGIYTWFAKYKDTFGNWHEHNGYVRLTR